MLINTFINEQNIGRMTEKEVEDLLNIAKDRATVQNEFTPNKVCVYGLKKMSGEETEFVQIFLPIKSLTTSEYASLKIKLNNQPGYEIKYIY